MQSTALKRLWKGCFNSNMTRADRLSLLVVIILGIFISSTTAYFVSQSQQKTRQLELENSAYVYISQADSSLKRNVNILFNMRGVYNASSSVDIDEFEIFTNPILNGHGEIQALEWIPRVIHEDRESHEKNGRKIGYSNYEIKEKSSSGKMTRAMQRNVYFPVFYVNPLTANEKAVGFDLASNMSRKEAMEKAINTGLPVATSPITLVQENQEQRGFLIFLPVYDETDGLLSIEQRREKTKGLVVVVYRINDLFELSVEPIKDPDLSVMVSDISSAESPVLLFSSMSKIKKHMEDNNQSYTASNNYSETIKVANRIWRFDFSHDNDKHFYSDWEFLLVFSVGLIFTIFIIVYILGNSRRRSEVEQLIKERTYELEGVKNRIQQVLDNTAEGICGIDIDGNTTFVNQAALEITGYKENEFLYLHQHSLIHYHYPDGSDYPGEKCKIYSVMLNGEKITVDNEVFWHKDGTAIPVEYTATPVKDDGEIKGVVIAFRDIRERKKYESEIIESRNNAELASKAKSIFLATMSHEIRTPMNGVIGMTQLLADTPLNSIQKDYVDTLIYSGQSLLNQINDILDFSRIEAGKLEIEVQAFDLEKCCCEIIQLMKNRAVEKGLKIELIYPAEIPKFVVGDRHRIQQILLNLLGNAIKFTSNGSIKLNVICKEQNTGVADFSLQVIDSGIGIGEEQQVALFDSFTQADASTTRKFGGSGLGLAISKQLAGLMNGEITLDSTLGKGSTFTLDIPLAVTSEDELETLTEVLETLAFHGRVLLVEDNKVNQKVARAMLHKFGLDISVADNGQLALEAFKKKDFDIILMDCQMPVMDGYTATREIRLLAKGKSIPILALTANVLPEDIHLCTDAGMNGCLHKPIELSVLQQALKKWLKYEVVSNESASANVNSSDTRSDIDKDDSLISETVSYVNTAHLDGLAVIMGDVFNELLPSYIKDTDSFFNNATDLIKNRDLETAERHAHSLKSSSRNVGATQLGDLAERLENDLRDKNIDNFSSVFKHAKENYQHVRKILLEFKPSS